MSDREPRRALIEFEIALDAAAADEVRAADWGRAFLSPSLPLVWNASWIALERTGLAMASVEALAKRRRSQLSAHVADNCERRDAPGGERQR